MLQHWGTLLVQLLLHHLLAFVVQMLLLLLLVALRQQQPGRDWGPIRGLGLQGYWTHRRAPLVHWGLLLKRLRRARDSWGDNALKNCLGAPPSQTSAVRDRDREGPPPVRPLRGAGPG